MKQELYELLKDYKHSYITGKLNYIKIPVSRLSFNKEGIGMFNRIYQLLLDDTNLHELARTPSGGISIAQERRKWPAWDIRHLKSIYEITIVDAKGCWRLQIRATTNEEEDKPYFNWWRKFLATCKKHGVNLNDLAIDNGEEVKKEVPSYIIDLESDADRGYEYEGNVHHIDFHSSFGGGVCKYYPELAPVYEELYEGRKEHKEYKQCITNSIGKFQSEIVHFKWAHIARDAIKDNNERINNLRTALILSGRFPILYNTDGIWYEGDIYHGPGEGDKMGEWSNDHINCRFRCKSKGAYEYIEDGKYHAVLRGKCALDYIKDRDDWEWGDIFRDDAVPYKYKFHEGYGIVEVEGDYDE